MINLTYAGIGSRETPYNVCREFIQLAKDLSSNGYTLYSGGADGADSAFELGAGNKKIFLPWTNFNQKEGIVKELDDAVLSYVHRFHPAPKSLSPAAIKLMARNTYQVLGEDLKSPVDFVLCWTKGGKEIGGTSQAIRIANAHNIPVFNFGDDKNRTLYRDFMNAKHYFS